MRLAILGVKISVKLLDYKLYLSAVFIAKAKTVFAGIDLVAVVENAKMIRFSRNFLLGTGKFME